MEILMLFLGAVIIHLLAHEIVAFGPSVSRVVLRFAVRCLPSQMRKRYHEEWLAHLDECPSATGKILFAFQCALGARALRVAGQAPFKVGARTYRIAINDQGMMVDGPTALHLLRGLLHVIKTGETADPQCKELEDDIAALEDEVGDLPPNRELLVKFGELTDRVAKSMPKIDDAGKPT